MRYLSTTAAQRAEMLRTIGAEDIEALIDRIPSKARLDRELMIPAALAEADLVAHLRALAERNADAERYVTFLGGGAYDHYIPSMINHMLLRGEFFTAYTPYQPEASQGTLRTIYEYQTMICELTGMDVTNASVYDGGSALAEAALMAHSVTERGQIVASGALSPLARRVVETYCAGPRLPVKTVPWVDGVTDLDALRKAVTGKTACVLVQYPNFFGCLEDLDQVAAIAHERGALLVVSVDPVALALLRPPGSVGADIVVGEGQALGNHLNFGGPYLGLFSCRKELVRRMPGRLVGATVDLDGDRGFVLTLQTREQHIRREKATSNICTNVALVALAATIHMALLGKDGLPRAATLSTAKAHYAAEMLGRVPGVSLRFTRPTSRSSRCDCPRTRAPSCARCGGVGSWEASPSGSSTADSRIPSWSR
jgi:glycine dehydrogenase subunit 1